MRASPGTPLTPWLMATPQLTAGAQAGGIAGLLADGTHASYVYPEIAGYYLRWLAFRAAAQDPLPPLAARAQATQRWLAQWCALPVPLTRVHLAAATDDWRNGALFCFDLAMVLRGVGSATAVGLLAPDDAVVRGIEALLARCIAGDGAFAAVMPLGDGALPQRWSTRRGAFLAKAATGVLRAATQLAVTPRLRDAAERTYAQSLVALDASPHPEVHPLLYACEGVLDLPQHAAVAEALPLVAARVDEVLAEVSPDGYLPESIAVHAPEPARIDVIAQALRVARLLALHGRPARDTHALARLQTALLRHVHTDGGVAFARESPAAQRNTWAAMFADQALAYASASPASEADWRRDPLLV